MFLAQGEKWLELYTGVLHPSPPAHLMWAQESLPRLSYSLAMTRCLHPAPQKSTMAQVLLLAGLPAQARFEAQRPQAAR